MNELGQRDILVTFAKLFKKNKVNYLLTGSLAVSYYGFPRATHDIDFVLEISNESKTNLITAMSGLGVGYIQDIALLQNEQEKFYTLFHTVTGIKIDLWLIASQDFENKLKRKQMVDINDEAIALVSPEDLILNKLLWCREIMSERHMRDCVGIWKVQKGKLDERYLDQRAQELNIADLLTVMKSTKDY